MKVNLIGGVICLKALLCKTYLLSNTNTMIQWADYGDIQITFWAECGVYFQNDK